MSLRVWLSERLLVDERSAVLPLLRLVLLPWLMWRRLTHLDSLGAGIARGAAFVDAPHLAAVAGVVGCWPLPASTVDVVGVVLVVAGVCAFVGVVTRVALVAFFAAFFVEYAVIAGQGFFYHTPALPAQLLVALAIWWRCRG